MPTQEDFRIIFEQFKPILQKYESRLVVTQNGTDGYSLNTPFSAKWGKELFFGAVQIKKNYVSFHLMPIYMYPDLLDGISDNLRKRMQGKSCFNFTASDKKLFAELSKLTKQSVDRVKKEELL